MILQPELLRRRRTRLAGIAPDGVGDQESAAAGNSGALNEQDAFSRMNAQRDSKRPRHRREQVDAFQPEHFRRRETTSAVTAPPDATTLTARVGLLSSEVGQQFGASDQAGNSGATSASPRVSTRRASTPHGSRPAVLPSRAPGARFFKRGFGCLQIQISWRTISPANVLHARPRQQTSAVHPNRPPSF